MEPCLEAKSNTLSYSWGGAFRAAILFSTLWRGCYQSLYVTENYLETREALTAVLSFFSSAKCNFLPAHEALLTAGYSKGEKEAWPPKPPKEMSVSKGSEYIFMCGMCLLHKKFSISECARWRQCWPFLLALQSLPAAAMWGTSVSLSGPHGEQMRTTHCPPHLIQNTSWVRWCLKMRRIERKRAWVLLACWFECLKVDLS